MLPLKDNVPTRAFPIVTVGIITVNAIVWVWEFTGTSVDTDVIHYGYYPCKVDGPCIGPALHAAIPWYEEAFTSMFMHGGWEHLLGNMLFLFIFGNNVEDVLGHVRFLVFYLVGGLAATALQTVFTLSNGSDADAAIPNLGASGAISAVLGAYLVLLPQARVLTLIFFILREVPAIAFLGFWFLFQVYSGGTALQHPEAAGGVALFAHIGGFVFGVVAIKLVQIRPPLRPSY